jgi:hypothetical protein
MGLNRSSRCVYCGSPSDSKDHVPPRLLLERPYPPNLLTVPSCTRCNQGWSKNEQYFLVLLSQIGTSQLLTGKTAKGGVVDRTLKRAPRLEQRLNDALQTDEEGRIVIAPESNRIHKVVTKIAHGLYVLRYKSISANVDIDIFISALAVTRRHRAAVATRDACSAGVVHATCGRSGPPASPRRRQRSLRSTRTYVAKSES